MNRFVRSQQIERAKSEGTHRRETGLLCTGEYFRSKLNAQET